MNEWSKIKRKGLGEVSQEISENIKAPETAPSDKRITGRTEQLNLKASREFKKRLKIIAAEEGCLMIEVMEKALEVYENQHQVQPTKNLFSHPNENFTCDNCEEKFKNLFKRG